MKRRILNFLFVIIMILLSFSSCLAIQPWERKKMYNYYTDDSHYFLIWGTIIGYEQNKHHGSGCILILLDEECSKNLEKAGDLGRFGYHNGAEGGVELSFGITPKSWRKLLNEKFLDLLDVLEIEDGTHETSYYVAPYAIESLVCPKIWYDGGARQLVSLRANEKQYLDYETGKANLLDWVQNDLK